MIGRRIFGKDAKRGFTAGFGNVAKDLIEGPVFLDDVNHVFEDARVAQFVLGPAPVCLSGASFGVRRDDFDDLIESGKFVDFAGPVRQLCGLKNLFEWDSLHRSQMVV